MRAHVSGAVLVAAVLAGSSVFAQQGADCSRDLLHVGATALDVTLCVPARQPRKAGTPVQVSVTETFAANGSSFSRTVPLEFMDGAQTSRTIDDVTLEKLGIAKSLHVTIEYRPGSVRLEHAMLVPGALSLK